jgi:hypothetical protein
MIYGFFPSPDMNEKDCQRLEDLINEEIQKRGLDARVRVNDSIAVMSFVPFWETDLNAAVDAGIERYRVREG